jgi:hypothetical protein
MQPVNGHEVEVGGPTGARSRRGRFLWAASPATSAPAAAVSDEQIRALVTAAESLGNRQRNRCADTRTAEADERLRRLDWAVRVGRLVLADRAARARTPPGAPAAGSAPPQPRL